MSVTDYQVCIVGCHGIPANYGGFETFAEQFSLHLAQRGWKVSVYCQQNGTGRIQTELFNDIELVHIPVQTGGALGTIVFDLKSTFHVLQRKGKILVLTLGYNTALFSLPYRIRRIPNIINMDGLEWKRAKWGLIEKAWLYLNERVGCLIANHLIADHPEIKKHLSKNCSKSKITTAPYTAKIIQRSESSLIEKYNLQADGYILVIARPEPENSILEIVNAFSLEQRNCKLVILGKYNRQIPYHRKVQDVTNKDVCFLGAIYDQEIVGALRFFARFYIHGHTVGGTNPSLVEALAAGSAVIAHDNIFNRWVAGGAACYFSDTVSCAEQIKRLLTDDAYLQQLKENSRTQMNTHFDREFILNTHEKIIRDVIENQKN